ncbi:hypothetical protein D3C73_1546870 [compost metagenome]
MEKRHFPSRFLAQNQLALLCLLRQSGLFFAGQGKVIQFMLLSKMGYEQIGEILPAQVIVPCNRLHLHHAFKELQHRDVEGSPA